MRKSIVWSAVAGLGLSLGLLATPASAVGVAAAAPPVTAAPPVSAEAQQVIDHLPEMRAQADAVRERLGLPDNPVRDALLNAIDPTQYECSTATPAVLTAILPDVASMTIDQLTALLTIVIYDIPLMDALYFPQQGPFTFGARGEFTHTVNKTFEGLKGFWDIPSSDVELVPAHGRIMLDAERDYRVFTVLYGANPAQSRFSADLIARELRSPVLGWGDLPIFSFNAFAAPGGEDVPGYGKSHRRIAYGDGVLDGFARVGLSDVAPSAILAHEFGHQVQFSDGLMRPELAAPEASRWAELEADAFSAYFLTHGRGESMNWKRVHDFGQMFYQLGDCGFTSAGHHGTPNQRMNSALWAAGLAASLRPRGYILPSRTFNDLFTTQYPQLIAPDATT